MKKEEIANKTAQLSATLDRLTSKATTEKDKISFSTSYTDMNDAIKLGMAIAKSPQNRFFPASRFARAASSIQRMFNRMGETNYIKNAKEKRTKLFNEIDKKYDYDNAKRMVEAEDPKKASGDPALVLSTSQKEKLQKKLDTYKSLYKKLTDGTVDNSILKPVKDSLTSAEAFLSDTSSGGLNLADINQTLTDFAATNCSKFNPHSLNRENLADDALKLFKTYANDSSNTSKKKTLSADNKAKIEFMKKIQNLGVNDLNEFEQLINNCGALLKKCNQFTSQFRRIIGGWRIKWEKLTDDAQREKFVTRAKVDAGNYFKIRLSSVDNNVRQKLLTKLNEQNPNNKELLAWVGYYMLCVKRSKQKAFSPWLHDQESFLRRELKFTNEKQIISWVNRGSVIMFVEGINEFMQHLSTDEREYLNECCMLKGKHIAATLCGCVAFISAGVGAIPALYLLVLSFAPALVIIGMLAAPFLSSLLYTPLLAMVYSLSLTTIFGCLSDHLQKDTVSLDEITKALNKKIAKLQKKTDSIDSHLGNKSDFNILKAHYIEFMRGLAQEGLKSMSASQIQA